MAGTAALVRALRRTVRLVATHHDEHSDVGPLFPGSSDLLLFTRPERVHAVLDAVRTLLLAAQGPFAAYQLRPEDLRMSSALVALPLEAPAERVLNAVWHDLIPADAGGGKLARDLDAILAADALRISLQPVVGLRRDGVLGYEALIRGPASSVLETPEALFGAAEACGRVEVLEDLCRHSILTVVPPRLPPDTLLFINIHPRRDPWGAVEAALRHGVAPARLVLEVSEQALLLTEGQVIRSLRRCQSAGAAVALDDVGRAFTGLPVLSIFPWNFLKFDRSLLVRAVHESRARTLLACLIRYARRIRAKAIIEGIESQAQRMLCRRLGIAWGQGYHLGGPLPLGPGTVTGTRGLP